MEEHRQSGGEGPQLVRGLGLLQATSLNVANMVGVGPFVTIPLFIATMQGPHVLIGWVAGAVLVACDGLVWSELGAALPGSGGTYHYFKEIFGHRPWARVLPFLFIWQFLLSGTLELASGYIGIMPYLKFALEDSVPQIAWIEANVPGGLGWIAAAICILVTVALARRIQVVGWFSVVLCAGTLLTTATIIVAGAANFDASLFDLPPDALKLDSKFAVGLGAAMLIAVYDFLGYYNICHLGEEVRDPGRTIPRAVLISVALVAMIYMAMNITIMGVVPWREAMVSNNIAAQFMEKLFGHRTAVLFTWLILWTAFASLFVMTLGYSRIPFAAARNGDFFRAFARVHPRDRYPSTSLFAVGGVTAAFCFFSLKDVITATVTMRIAIQFLGQIFALHILRTTRPDVRLPFRMWLYPVPSLVAFSGWIFVLGCSGWIFLASAAGIAIAGVVVYANWQRPGAPRP